ncbi:unnamed protein product [Trypanosoma congolense IL3000]|uniref:WGS project CAEQ00000000 data, annotated contig 794 n=1 Tax=Trypanosoma congolense (strain IL3000) TaxID=1068625 RepID=F9WIH8_TRYCI|nr:unnamed protein product [Trypanosoma congolense IL3000]
MAERDSEDMQSTDVHEDVDDMQNMSKSTPVSIKDRAEKLRQATLEEIEERDKILEEAVQMFMENNVKDAEDIINENAPLDPFHALGAASIAAFKAMLLMEDSDMKHALEKASFATSFASKVAVAPKSAFSSMLNMFRSEPEQKLQPGMFRAKTIYALALSVHGTVLILQDSWSALIQGGMALRKCYGILQSQRRVLDQLKKRLGANSYDGLGVDRNSVYGLLLMLGATHIVLSLLPPHLQTILSFFGINFDRDRGLDLISVTRKSETIFSPFAALFLMVITCAVPSFCSYHVPKWLPLAKAVAEDAMKPLRMDEFLLYRCIVNRISGLEHDVSKSISTLSRCLETAEQGQIAQWLPQLCVFALYDQGWNLVITSQWREAAVIYRRLDKPRDG